MVVTESVTESVFSKASGLSNRHESFTINVNDGVYDRFCSLSWFKAVTESILSESSGLFYKCQWRSLVPKSVLAELHTFILNGNDLVCDGFCDVIDFKFKLWRSICLVKLQTLYCKWQRPSLVPKSVLIKLQVFTIRGNDWVCDGCCDGICCNLSLLQSLYLAKL